MVQHLRQPPAIGGDHPLEKAFRGAGEAVLFAQGCMAEHAGAHHGRQGQRDHGGDQNRHRQGDGKLAEQTAHDIAHKQQRDQHRDQREGEGDDSKANFARTLQRRRQRLLAFFDIAGDVLNHHDGVIHHEAGSDSQRHQRQVVDREVEEHHHRKGAYQRQRHRHGRNDGGRDVAQEQVDDHHDQGDGQHQFKLGVVHRGANVSSTIRQDLHRDRLWQALGELGQQRADAVCGRENIGPRLALDVHHNRLLLVGPRPQPAVLRPLLDGRHVAEADRCPVLVGDNQAAIIFGRLHLIVRGEGHRPRRAIEATLRRVNVVIVNCSTYGFAGQPECGNGLGVQLHSYRRTLAAGEGNQPDAGDLGDLLRDTGLDHILNLGHRHRG